MRVLRNTLKRFQLQPRNVKLANLWNLGNWKPQWQDRIQKQENFTQLVTVCKKIGANDGAVAPFKFIYEHK